MSQELGLTELIEDLRSHQGSPPDSEVHIPEDELSSLAEIVGRIIRNPPLGLDAEINAMWATLERSPYRNMAAIVPTPNSSIRHIARLWKLQILVLLGQALGRRRRRLIPAAMTPDLRNVNQIVVAVRDSWVTYVKTHGPIRVRNQLIEAVTWLQRILPNGVGLVGRVLYRDGVPIHPPLRGKRQLFLKLLLDADGQTVSGADFAKHGIRRPDLLKGRLVLHPSFTFLEDHILPDSGTGGYMLVNP